MEKEKPPLVRRGAYDEFEFEQQIEAREMQDYESDLQDVFSAMYRRKWRFDKEYENADLPLKSFLKDLKVTEEYKRLKQTTAGNGNEAYVAAEKLMEKFHMDYPDAKDKSERRDVCRQAAREAQEEAEAFAEAYGLCGMDDKLSDEKFGGSEIEKIKKLRNLLKQERYRKALALAGRAQATAEHIIETRVDRGDSCPVGVEFGDDLSKTLAGDLMLMKTDPDLFTIKLADKSLAQYVYEGKKPQTKGPIIVLLDMSSSMQGLKFSISCAFLFGMYLIAKDQSREFWVIGFNDYVKFTQEIRGMKDLLDIIDRRPGGGTDFDKPLNAGTKLLDEAAEKNRELKKADLFMITDGFGYVSQPVMDFIKTTKEKLSFKIISAFVMEAAERKYQRDAVTALRQFSEEVFPIADESQFDEFAEKGYGI